MLKIYTILRYFVISIIYTYDIYRKLPKGDNKGDNKGNKENKENKENKDI